MTEHGFDKARFLAKLAETRVLHCFARGAMTPPWSYFAVEVHRYSQRSMDRSTMQNFVTPVNCLDGVSFLRMIVDGHFATAGQVNALFVNAVPGFDIRKETPSYWSTRPTYWFRGMFLGRFWPGIKVREEMVVTEGAWPSFDSEGNSMAALARMLGKDGVQRYAWDGGYGDVNESWPTVFVCAKGGVAVSNTQTYGLVSA